MKKLSTVGSSAFKKHNFYTIYIVQQRTYARQARGSFISEYGGAEANPHTSFPVAAVFGANGFVGRSIVQELATAGYQVITPFRGSEFKVQEHKVMGDVGQIVAMRYATDKYETIVDICARSNIVVNAVGRLYPKWFDDNWEYANVTVPGMIARAAKQTNVDRFVHISHLGAHVEHPSKYLRIKAYSEMIVKEEFPTATILRAADAFGTLDRFLNHFGKRLQANRFFGVPIVAQGQGKVQPVFVSNIADGVVASLGILDSEGKTYELGGPKVYKINEVIKFVADFLGAAYTVTPLPIPVAKVLGMINEYRSHKATFTRDWVTRCQYDNVVSENALTFKDLAVDPVPLEEAAVNFLRRYQRFQGYLVNNNYDFVKQ
jgi:uncharacterized protein YbjT (DUF2867 family)